MSRALALAVAVGVLFGACGGDEGQQADIPPASPVDSSGCSPLAYAGEGRPDVLIASSTLLQGQFRDHGVQAAQAEKAMLAERGWRAGDYTVGLQVCDEVAASGDAPSLVKCRRNARAFARNRSVLAVIGPHTSACAREMLPILNRSRGGPLPAISGSATYLGLTRSGAGVEDGAPGRFFPSGQRSFVRIIPADDVLGAAGALFAEREGARSVFALNDGEAYGFGVAEAFRLAAERSGLRVAGTARWDPKAREYRVLANRIRAAGADAVYLGGSLYNNGPQLIKDLREVLGPDVQITGPDAFNQAPPIVEGAGTAAEGFAPTIAVVPGDELPDPGREYVKEFERRFSTRPCCFAVHLAQITDMVLDAIAASDGSRAQVLRNLFEARVEDGLVGDFEIDRYGDTTLNTIAVYQIDGARLRFHAVITPPAELLARR